MDNKKGIGFIPLSSLPMLCSLTSLGIAALCIFLRFCISQTALNVITIIALVPGLGALCYSVVCRIRGGGNVRTAAASLGALFVCLCFSAQYYNVGLQFSDAEKFAALSQAGGVRVLARIDELRYSTDYSYSADITILRSEKAQSGLRARFTSDRPCTASPGELALLDIKAEIIPFSFGDYFGSIYMYSHGIFLTASPADDAEMRPTGMADKTIASAMRSLSSLLSDRILFSCGQDCSPACALLLGQKKLLPQSLRADLRTLGLSHLAAVSGLHLSIIVGFADLILRRKANPVLRGTVNASLSLMLMLLAGCTPSVTRCALMNLVTFGASALSLRIKPQSALALSLGIIAFFDPTALLDIGLILSALATLALCRSGNRIEAFVSRLFGTEIQLPLIRSLCTAFLLTLVVLLYTIPVSVLAYGSISIASPLANMIFVPLAAIILLTSPFVIAFGGIRYFGALFTFPLRAECRLFTALARLLGQRGFDISIGIPQMLIILLIAAVTVISLNYLKALHTGGALKERPYKKARIMIPSAALILSVSILGISYLTLDRSPHFDTFSDGANDCVIFTAAGSLTAFDISNGSDYAPDLLEERALAAHSSHRTLVLTHYHQRHAANVISLIERQVLDRIILPSPQNDTDRTVFSSITAAAKLEGCEISIFDSTVQSSAEEQTAKGGKLVISLPPRCYINRSTHPVISFALSFDGETLLYVGGAVFESSLSGHAADMAEKAGTIFFGSHSPIVKAPLPPQITPGGRKIIFGSEDTKNRYGADKSVSVDCTVIS